MTDLSLLQDFVTETVEHLEEMEGNLLQLEADPGNRETLNDIFRSVHTIKGAAEYLGMERIAELSHKLENLLDLMRHSERSAGPEIIDLLMAARDRIGLLIADLHQTQTEQADIEDLLDRIQSVGGGQAPSPQAEPQPAAVNPPAAETYEEEHDEELFGIFLEQLQEGLEALQSWTDAMAGADPTDRIEILGRCLAQMEPLRSSANYMGYDRLTALYDRWHAAMESALERLGGGDDGFLSAFLREDMQSPIDEIAAAFPRLKLTGPAPQAQQGIAQDDPFGVLEAVVDETQGDAEPQPTQALPGHGESEEIVAPHAAHDAPRDDLNLFAEEDPEQETFRLRSEKEGPLDLALLQDFIAETVEHLGEMEGNLLVLESDPDNHDVLNDIFRAMHTIKGAAEYMGMARIAELSHKLENLLDLMRRDKCRASRDLIDLLMSARDRIGLLTADLHQTQSEQSDIDDLLVRIQSRVASYEGSPEPAPEAAENEAPPEAPAAPGDAADREIYDEEYDEELFGIFLEQLQEGLDALQSWTDALPEADRTDRIELLGRCLSQIDPLRSSANYMGYRKLTGLYDRWSDAIGTARERLEAEEEKFLPAFMAGCMQATLDDIRRCFPSLKSSASEAHVPPSGADSTAVPGDGLHGDAGMAADLLDVYADTPDVPSGQSAAPDPFVGLSEGESLFDRLSRSFDRRMAENQIFEPHAAPSGMDWELFSESEDRPGTTAESKSAPTAGRLMEEEDLPADEGAAPEVDVQKAAGMAVPSIGDPSPPAAVEEEDSLFIPDTPSEDATTPDTAIFEETQPEVEPSLPPAETVAEETVGDPSQAGEQPVKGAADDLPATTPVVVKAPPVKSKDASPAEKSPSLDLDRSPGDRRDPFQRGRRQSDRIGEQLLRQSIRVDAAKIDALMNQVGELVVSRAWFSQLFHEMRDLQQNLQHYASLESREMKQVKGLTFRLSEATVALGRVANELQEGVMKVRMLPIAQLFNRYPRLVFDLVRNGDKKVRLDIKGEETELDKMVIEAISDPLIHIIRNAVDHGIEPVEERKGSGKPESGIIHLEAYHEGNHVVIEIADDGRGLDMERIKAKAVSGGFAAREEIERMPPKELTGLIMQPGFSTAAEITHTSGRGVGMDVVKQNIEKLNGTIEIDSTPGVGTQFRIKIPLTLAIIPALLVQVRGELFTIPLSTVEETIRIAPRDLSTIEGVEVMQLRENTLPLVRLAELFNMPADTTGDGRAFVVVVSTGMKRVGLVVDVLLGQEEVVIKPLEDYLQEKSGFSGATILGDGRISLILDIYELVNLSIDRQSRRKQAAASV